MGWIGTAFFFLAALAAPALLPQAPVISAIPDQVVAPGVVSAPITFTITDGDTAQSALKVTAVARDTTLIPTEGITLSLGRTGVWSLRLTPAARQTGKTAVAVTASDGRLSGTQTFAVTVENQNTPPTISDTPNQVIPAGGTSGRLSFSVGDAQTAATDLQVRAAHDNTALISQSGLVLGGSGAARTLTVTPIPGAEGTATVTISVSDGTLTTSDSFVVNVAAFDFGDAPDAPYPTLRANSGATHRVVKGYQLGASNDAEPEGQPNTTASGDGTQDDGILFLDPLLPGQSARLTVRLVVPAGSAGAVDGWIDFDGDGKWNENEEHVVNARLVNGDTTVTVVVPSAARLGGTFARFRLSQEGVVEAAGFSSEAGEVEDYQVEIKQGVRFDFGDAPDPTYPTTLKNDGARHVRNADVYLGSSIDAEADGQPHPSALGDDLNPTAADDEDGVQFTEPLPVGGTGTVAVRASIKGLLWAWIDFNGDGDWLDAGEQAITAANVVAGVNTLSFAVPAASKDGSTFSRFRFTTSKLDGFTGEAPDGEVEDLAVRIATPEVSLDFGDAPDTYRTVLASDGARHRVLRGFSLGKQLDPEKDGQPNPSATGDDLTPSTLDDEEGVSLVGTLIAGQSGTFSVEASSDGRLDAWIDFNIDGDFADPGERIFTAFSLLGGVNTLGFVVPATVKEGATLARFRLSREGVKDYFGEAPDGEVEDYQIRISAPEVKMDFGDAPDPTYPTTLKSNGARHRVNPDVFLGRRIDAETDGQPTASATGDDAAPAGSASDEDGVALSVPLVPGQTGQVAVQASTQGLLSAWIDFNQDGDWSDPGEEIFANTSVVGGVNNLTFAVPTDAKSGSAFTRFRFSRVKMEGFTGEAFDGEVEDGTVRVSTPQVNLDFGDAPDPTYPTTLKNNGARHRINPDVFLGQRIDAEADGQPNAGSSGDDANPAGAADDEDGVEVKL
ncbi:MAG: hypothetical protein IT580_12925, partial [Verrucomicrobiales bacterium]|nr:hypothetical protein [Verrucomicrobiales bacterium]